MHIRLLAVGDRQPAWVDDAVGRYAARLPREWRFQLDSVAAAKRGKNDKSQRVRREEGAQLLARIDTGERVVLLDERGKQMTTRAFADKLSGWQAEGRNLCFIIGGPDGVCGDCRQRADFTWSLSSLTLPHGMARVLCVEQLYRAWSLQSGHPYHRE